MTRTIPGKLDAVALRKLSAPATTGFQPGNSVRVYDHHDVIDGAEGTVLGINSQGWLSVRLSRSGACLILSASKVRRIDEHQGGAS